MVGSPKPDTESHSPLSKIKESERQHVKAWNERKKMTEELARFEENRPDTTGEQNFIYEREESVSHELSKIPANTALHQSTPHSPDESNSSSKSTVDQPGQDSGSDFKISVDNVEQSTEDSDYTGTNQDETFGPYKVTNAKTQYYEVGNETDKDNITKESPPKSIKLLFLPENTGDKIKDALIEDRKSNKQANSHEEQQIESSNTLLDRQRQDPNKNRTVGVFDIKNNLDLRSQNCYENPQNNGKSYPVTGSQKADTHFHSSLSKIKECTRQNTKSSRERKNSVDESVWLYKNNLDTTEEQQFTSELEECLDDPFEEQKGITELEEHVNGEFEEIKAVTGPDPGTPVSAETITVDQCGSKGGHDFEISANNVEQFRKNESFRSDKVKNVDRRNNGVVISKTDKNVITEESALKTIRLENVQEDIGNTVKGGKVKDTRSKHKAHQNEEEKTECSNTVQGHDPHTNRTKDDESRQEKRKKKVNYVVEYLESDPQKKENTAPKYDEGQQKANNELLVVNHKPKNKRSRKPKHKQRDDDLEKPNVNTLQREAEIPCKYRESGKTLKASDKKLKPALHTPEEKTAKPPSSATNGSQKTVTCTVSEDGKDVSNHKTTRAKGRATAKTREEENKNTNNVDKTDENTTQLQGTRASRCSKRAAAKAASEKIAETACSEEIHPRKRRGRPRKK